MARPGELRMAEWQEFDLDNAVWKIPAERMKMRRPHEVPLSRQVLAYLHELFALTGPEGYVFPAFHTSRRPLSENTVNQSFRRMGYAVGEVMATNQRGRAADTEPPSRSSANLSKIRDETGVVIRCALRRESPHPNRAKPQNQQPREFYGLDEDTVDLLLRCLKVWTSSTWSNGQENIYHEHGIPQGPLASGMLSEAVLQHIDTAGERGRKTIYLRYVDDIKILAKNEDELRRKLIALDIASKEIGLFPQTAKINIRKITDPRDEVKSISRPPEPSIKPAVNQLKLVSRLLELTRSGRVSAENITRFKYLLAHATPTHKLNARLMKVLHRHPELALGICRYISAYGKIPVALSNQIECYVSTNELYHAVNAQLLRSCLGKCSPADVTP